MTKFKHLILYDGDCPFCNLAVRHIIAIDRKERFVFSPLNGKIAHDILSKNYSSYIEMDTLILVENYQKHPRIFIRSKAILRVYWTVGRSWKFLGIVSFLPVGLGDLFYRLFALSRYRLKIKTPKGSISKDRAIP